MSSNNKSIVNILLFGLPRVGKSSLCQAFGSDFVEGFSYGVGLSERARKVEFVTENCVYHIIDAPGIYDQYNLVNTQNHANEINRILKLSSTPYVICFVIRLEEIFMAINPSDIMMMETITHYYSQGQAKFSLIVNRLTENGISTISNNYDFGQEFLRSFKRSIGVSITHDNVLFIRDGFLSYSREEQRELLSFYLRKFEVMFLPELDGPNLTLYYSPAEIRLDRLCSSLERVEALIREHESRGYEWRDTELENIYQQERQLRREIEETVKPYTYQRPDIDATGNNNQQISTSDNFVETAGAFLAGAAGIPAMNSRINPLYNVAGALAITAITGGCSIM